jgi:ADA HAT complex component 1
MLMFRFWGSDSRGSDKTVQVGQPMFDLGKPAVQHFVSESIATSPPRPAKRRRSSTAAIASPNAPVVAVGTAAAATTTTPTTTVSTGASPVVKRQRLEDGGSFPTKKEVVAALAATTPHHDAPTRPAPKMASLERAKQVIELEFSQEILFKHQELRFVDQELAKCQIALEQLRRCHLIPYPVNVPTPEQMLSIASGQGPALQAAMGAQVPQWAPPFGVTDGPYARHLAKWLIPDPKFDGMLPPPLHAESTRSRASVDGRSTRYSVGEIGGAQTKSRRVRESASQKLQALPDGYSQPKGKSGPCVLKRAADGKMVKLVCVKCHRDNFSSTQGFINHCRIAHKIEYKSHEEAAIACGHPFDANEAGGIVGDEKQPQPPQQQQPLPPPLPAVVSCHVATAPAVGGPVHLLARENAMDKAEACFAVVRRIEDVMDQYERGEIEGPVPGVTDKPAPVQAKPAPVPSQFTPSADVPNLSRLAKLRGSGLDLAELVRDAKTKVDFDDILWSDDESEAFEVEPAVAGIVQSDQVSSATAGMRMPARKHMSPIPPPILPVSIRPPASIGRTAPAIPYATPVPTPAPRLSAHEPPECPLDDEMDIDLSPNTAVSNNAPSLVSDDDEYDDSVDGSSDESEVNDTIDTESISDVAEIHLDDEGPRSIRHHRGSSSAGPDAMALRKDESKHVTFMSPVREMGTPTTQTPSGLKRKKRL